AALGGEGKTDQAARMGGHEVHVLRADHVGGDDEVTLVLAILVVHEDDHLALTDVFDQFFNGIQFHGRAFQSARKPFLDKNSRVSPPGASWRPSSRRSR